MPDISKEKDPRHFLQRMQTIKTFYGIAGLNHPLPLDPYLHGFRAINA